MIKYVVYRYFDTYPEKVVFKNISRIIAEKVCNDFNKRAKNKPLTEYIMKEEIC